jgi:hypothetical protein
MRATFTIITSSKQQKLKREKLPERAKSVLCVYPWRSLVHGQKVKVKWAPFFGGLSRGIFEPKLACSKLTTESTTYAMGCCMIEASLVIIRSKPAANQCCGSELFDFYPDPVLYSSSKPINLKDYSWFFKMIFGNFKLEFRDLTRIRIRNLEFRFGFDKSFESLRIRVHHTAANYQYTKAENLAKNSKATDGRTDGEKQRTGKECLTSALYEDLPCPLSDPVVFFLPFAQCKYVGQNGING